MWSEFTTEVRRQRGRFVTVVSSAVRSQTEGQVVDLVEEEEDDDDEVQILEEPPKDFKRGRSTSVARSDPVNDEVKALDEESFTASVKRARPTSRDWCCSYCKHDNVPAATTCAMCNRPKGPSNKQEKEQNKQQWTCQEGCNASNVVSKLKCIVRGEPLIPPTTLDRITIVTLNVAGFGNSYVAPKDFDHIQSFTRELTFGGPDVICLQEGLDDSDEWYEKLLPGYKCLGRASSHSDGLVMLFIKDSLQPFATVISVNAPAVFVRIQYAGEQSVVIGTCHLPQPKGDAPIRLAKMREMLSHCRSQDMVLIAGDFNLRQAEDPDFEALGLSDAWKEAGASNDNRFTWNSFLNKYHENEFLRGRTGRFDRIYFRGLALDDFKMCANEQLSANRGHFLSDHFGLRATVKAMEGDVDI